MKSDVEELQRTCKQIESCIEGSKFIKTKLGGYFTKDKRKININVDPYNKKSCQ